MVHYCPTCQRHYVCSIEDCSCAAKPQTILCPDHDPADDSTHAHRCTGCYRTPGCEDDECEDKKALYKLCASCQTIDEEDSR